MQNGTGGGNGNNPANWSRIQFDSLEACYAKDDARTTEERIACLRRAIRGNVNVSSAMGIVTPFMMLRVLEMTWLEDSGLLVHEHFA